MDNWMPSGLDSKTFNTGSFGAAAESAAPAVAAVRSKARLNRENFVFIFGGFEMCLLIKIVISSLFDLRSACPMVRSRKSEQRQGGFRGVRNVADSTVPYRRCLGEGL